MVRVVGAGWGFRCRMERLPEYRDWGSWIIRLTRLCDPLKIYPMTGGGIGLKGVEMGISDRVA